MRNRAGTEAKREGRGFMRMRGGGVEKYQVIVGYGKNCRYL